MKDGDLQLDLFSNSFLDAFIKFLCTDYFLLCAYFSVYSCTIFIIK